MLTVPLAGTVRATACTITWDGGAATTVWTDDTNWDTDVEPAASDNVCIPSTEPVILDAAVTIAGLRTTGTTPTGSLTIASSGSLTLTDPGQGVLRFPLHVNGWLLVGGTDGYLRVLEGGSGTGSLAATGLDRLRFGGMSADDCGVDGCIPEAFVLGDGGELGGGVTFGVRRAITPVDMFDPLSSFCPDGPVQSIEPRCPDIAVLRIPGGATATATGVNTIYASVVEGKGTLRVEGTLHWTTDPILDARQEGAGRTIVADGAKLLIDGEFGPHPDNGLLGYGCLPVYCGQTTLGDRRVLVNRGTTILREAGFIAADPGTMFLNLGAFRIENDRGYFRGPFGAGLGRGAFRNLGVIAKTAGGCMALPGTPNGSSQASCIIDARYSGDGVVRVTNGRLFVYGAMVEAYVAPSRRVATGTTTNLENGIPNGVVTHKDYATAVRNSGKRGRIFLVTEVSPAAVPFGYVPVGLTSQIVNGSVTETTAVVRMEMDDSLRMPRNPERIVVYEGSGFVPLCDGPDPTRLPCRLGPVETSLEGDAVVEVLVELDPGSPNPWSGRARTGTVSFTNVYCEYIEALSFDSSTSGTRVRLAPGQCLDLRYIGTGEEPRVTEQRALGDEDTYLINSFRSDQTPAFVAAGTYVLVDRSSEDRARIAVAGLRPRVYAGPTIRWAWDDVAGCTCRFIVQFRRQGASTWDSFRTTSQHGDAFDRSGGYQFRVKTVNAKTGASSKWSPIMTHVF